MIKSSPNNATGRFGEDLIIEVARDEAEPRVSHDDENHALGRAGRGHQIGRAAGRGHQLGRAGRQPS